MKAFAGDDGGGLLSLYLVPFHLSRIDFDFSILLHNDERDFAASMKHVMTATVNSNQFLIPLDFSEYSIHFGASASTFLVILAADFSSHTALSLRLQISSPIKCWLTLKTQFRGNNIHFVN